MDFRRCWPPPNRSLLGLLLHLLQASLQWPCLQAPHLKCNSAELIIINNDNCSERYNQYNIIYVVVVVYLEDIKLFVLERIKKEINAA